ncbi:MAG: cystathionine gamma-synthase [Candidatus Dadabacteria bacterium]|nr:MAG: cystathionine gamma-synthase [Candidatus Dadabacteria bacterium]
MDKKRGFSTIAIHGGQKPDPSTGAIMTPVYMTSTYVQESPGVFKENYDYSRSANPTRTALEKNLALLEGGEHGICFSSGCATIDAVLHMLKAGDHVILSDDVYGGTYRIFDRIFRQLGVEFTTVNLCDEDAFKDAFRAETKLVWLETPTNPLLKVIDIEMASSLAKTHGALLAVDNTFATPYLQNPLSLGADIVSHSCTKYLGGHSDLVGGALIVNDRQLAESLHYIQNAVGAVPSPFDCFMLLRSTKTLPVRMEQHCQNAMAIAQFLDSHPKVKEVMYPGLEKSPYHTVAKKQMKDFGGMVSFVIDGGLKEATRFLESVEIFSLAESLGGVESLIEHPAIMTHATIPKDQREALGITDGFIRLSVGIEDCSDLIDDLTQALDRV